MAWKRIPRADCPHRAKFGDDATSNADRCTVCGEGADLRRCLTCGAVHCCESHQAHNTAHFKDTGHPFIQPHRVAEANWTWCYGCDAFLV